MFEILSELHTKMNVEFKQVLPKLQWVMLGEHRLIASDPLAIELANTLTYSVPLKVEHWPLLGPARMHGLPQWALTVHLDSLRHGPVAHVELGFTGSNWGAPVRMIAEYARALVETWGLKPAPSSSEDYVERFLRFSRPGQTTSEVYARLLADLSSLRDAGCVIDPADFARQVFTLARSRVEQRYGEMRGDLAEEKSQ